MADNGRAAPRLEPQRRVPLDPRWWSANERERRRLARGEKKLGKAAARAEKQAGPTREALEAQFDADIAEARSRARNDKLTDEENKAGNDDVIRLKKEKERALARVDNAVQSDLDRKRTALREGASQRIDARDEARRAFGKRVGNIGKGGVAGLGVSAIGYGAFRLGEWATDQEYRNQAGENLAGRALELAERRAGGEELSSEDEEFLRSRMTAEELGELEAIASQPGPVERIGDALTEPLFPETEQKVTDWLHEPMGMEAVNRARARVGDFLFEPGFGFGNDPRAPRFSDRPPARPEGLGEPPAMAGLIPEPAPAPAPASEAAGPRPDGAAFTDDPATMLHPAGETGSYADALDDEAAFLQEQGYQGADTAVDRGAAALGLNEGATGKIDEIQSMAAGETAPGPIFSPTAERAWEEAMLVPGLARAMGWNTDEPSALTDQATGSYMMGQDLWNMGRATPQLGPLFREAGEEKTAGAQVSPAEQARIAEQRELDMADLAEPQLPTGTGAHMLSELSPEARDPQQIEEAIRGFEGQPASTPDAARLVPEPEPAARIVQPDAARLVPAEGAGLGDMGGAPNNDVDAAVENLRRADEVTNPRGQLPVDETPIEQPVDGPRGNPFSMAVEAEEAGGQPAAVLRPEGYEDPTDWRDIGQMGMDAFRRGSEVLSTPGRAIGEFLLDKPGDENSALEEGRDLVGSAIDEYGPALGNRFGELRDSFASGGIEGAFSDIGDTRAGEIYRAGAEITSWPARKGIEWVQDKFNGGEAEAAPEEVPEEEPVPAPGTGDMPEKAGINEPAAPPPGTPAGQAIVDALSQGYQEASLADDAEAAEEELNWIQRQMRDRFGWDEKERAQVVKMLAAAGSTMATTPGNAMQGISAGAGAAADAMAEDAKLQYEYDQDAYERQRQAHEDRRQAAMDALTERKTEAQIREIEAKLEEANVPEHLRDALAIQELTQFYMSEEGGGLPKEEAQKWAFSTAGKRDPNGSSGFDWASIAAGG